MTQFLTEVQSLCKCGKSVTGFCDGSHTQIKQRLTEEMPLPESQVQRFNALNEQQEK
jgi:CDGSH-type Zn-finger protein